MIHFLQPLPEKFLLKREKLKDLTASSKKLFL